MKTRTWLLIFAAMILLCGSFLLFFRPPAAETARILSDGTLVAVIDLTEDAEYHIPYGDDWNIVQVRNGKIQVESSSCANQDCVRRGAADGGAPIVCLPNRLVIEFTTQDGHDAIIG